MVSVSAAGKAKTTDGRTKEHIVDQCIVVDSETDHPKDGGIKTIPSGNLLHEIGMLNAGCR